MPAHKQKVSIADVATSVGVSKVAVSYVVNNRQGEVSPETRQRIMQAIRDLGYRPPPSKRARDRGRCDVLGIVAGCDAIELAKPSYYNAIFQGVLEKTPAAGVHVTLFAGDMFELDTAEKVRFYCDGRCDGLLLMGLRAESSLPEVLDERGIPYVIIGDPRALPGAVSVDVDHEHGIRGLVNHLLDLGHTRIGFIGGPDFVAAAQIRLDLFRRTVDEYGFTPYELTPVNVFPETPTERWIEELMAWPTSDRPTAFIGWNDRAARVALLKLTSLGIDVPRLVSVVGFDDTHESDSQPRMSNYRQPFAEIGRRAVQLCLQRFENTVNTPTVELIRGHMVVRESTGPAPHTISSP